MTFLSVYSFGLGQPPMHCEVCGGRVPPDSACPRHELASSVWQVLRDKFLGLRIHRHLTTNPSPFRRAKAAGIKVMEIEQ